MFSFLGGMFSNSSVINKVVSGIDSMILTDQERIEYNQKRRENYIELEKSVNQQSTPRALTRRYIAIPVVYVTLISYISVFILAIFELSSVTNARNALDFMTMPFLAVVGFYFGDHLLDKITRK